MMQIYTGLTLLVISLIVLCEGQRQSRCPAEDVHDLVYGQSFYTLNDSTGGDPDLALRNDTMHKIHPEYAASAGVNNVTFTILVPNIFHGVEIRKITVQTRNVIQVVVEVTKESEIEALDSGDLNVYGGGVGVLVDDLDEINKFQRSTFEVPGDIARVKIFFYRGTKGKIRIQKLYISACKGKT